MVRPNGKSKRASTTGPSNSKTARHTGGNQPPILPDGQITSDFQKSCQASKSKIFCFAPDPNQFTDSHRLVPKEGRWPTSSTRGGMRWTRRRQASNSEPDEWRCSGRPSRVVLTPRCWRQVCEKKRRRRCQTSLVTGESTK